MTTKQVGTRLDDKLNLILIAVSAATLLTFSVGAAWDEHQAAELAAAPAATTTTVVALAPAHVAAPAAR